MIGVGEGGSVSEFYYKEFKSKKIFCFRGEGEGEGARVSELFFLLGSKSKIKNFFWGGGGWGLGEDSGWGGWSK